MSLSIVVFPVACEPNRIASLISGNSERSLINGFSIATMALFLFMPIIIHLNRFK
jgi:hypothetical protein